MGYTQIRHSLLYCVLLIAVIATPKKSKEPILSPIQPCQGESRADRVLSSPWLQFQVGHIYEQVSMGFDARAVVNYEIALFRQSLYNHSI